MRDVARAASVSVMTVSRVVNHAVGVDDTTRSRVETAIDALGYLPNDAASALRRTGARTRTVGLVVDDVANPFCSALQRGVERACRRDGSLLVAGSSGGSPEEERSLVRAFLRRRVDGLVVMGCDPDQEYLAQEAQRGVPTVFVDREPAGTRADCVVTDNVAAARTGTEHLLDRGHRRVVVLAGRLDVDTTGHRLTGYREALAGRGLHPEPGLELADLPDAAAATAALGAVLAGPGAPTAVLAAQNLLTVGAIRALHARGLQHAVALVGFDDIELADLLDPPVTLVRQDPDRIGAEAARMLFERVDGHDGPARRVVLPPELVVRGSGEQLPDPTSPPPEAPP